MPTQAEILRDQGIQRAVDHADREVESWSDKAMDMLLTCVRARGHGADVTSESIRNFAEFHDLPPPPDKRAWGAVMLKASRLGVIRKVGYTTANDPKVHCNPVSLWRVQ